MHALQWLYEKENKIFDAVLMLQPTSPIRNIAEIKKAIRKFKKNDLKSLISVTKMKEHPYECIKYVNKKWNYLVKNDGAKIINRQNYKKNFYFIDGSFYLAKVNFLKINKSFFSEKHTNIFILNQNWPVDIDVKDDLLIANSFIKK